MSQTILQCQQVSKFYQQAKQKIVVLEDINFSVCRGETIAITGSSGAGKSTLLNLLGGLDTCSIGSVLLQGQSYADLSDKQLAALRNQQLGFVYQFHHLLSEFSALENTAMPLLIRGINKKQAYQQAAQCLDSVGLAARFEHRPAQLSGGERQRVAIARAIVGKPACVLMDEPTGNLDEQTAAQIQRLLLALNQQLAISFVVVTHDSRMADLLQRRFVLHNGQLTP